MIVTHSQADLRESRFIPVVADTIHWATPANSAGNTAFLIRQYVELCDINEFGFSVIPAQAGIQIAATLDIRQRGNDGGS